MDRPTVIPLLRYQDMLWALTAGVGGVPSLFLLDTAAGLTTLDRALAQRLEPETAGTFRGERMTGEVVTLDLAHDVAIALGDRTIQHATVGVFDLQGLLPEGWPPVGGAIGLPTFHGVAVRIDLPAAQLTLGAEPAPGAAQLGVRLQRDGPAVDLFVEVKAPTGSLWMEVDTANTGPVILSPAAARRLGIGSETGETTLEVVGVGPVATRFVVRPIRYDGNLGAPFLAARALTIDLVNERAWLEGGP